MSASVDLAKLRSPILFEGDGRTAYRDPAACCHAGTFYVYMTVGTIDPDGLVYWQTAWSKSTDLLHWSAPRSITPKDLTQNFSSPGNVLRVGDEFVLCLQTYPTPRPEDKWGDPSSRIWTRRSKDLEHWEPPELIRVMGPDVSREAMGRTIDPYLVRDKDDPGKHWCFYKHDGKVKYSWSPDLVTWIPAGVAAGGENPCVIVDHNEYVLFYAPRNGIGVKRSTDMQTWRDEGILTLGLEGWDWARGRLSAGFVLDLRADPRVGKALMFFHGSRWPEDDPRGGWANHVNIGLAWSDDLRQWQWPGPSGG